MSSDVTKPAKIARDNPYWHFTHAEVRSLFNIGEKSFRRLAELGAPLVAEKVNADHLKQWLWIHRDEVGKLTD